MGWTTQQIKRKEAILISPSCRKGVWLWERYRGIFGGSFSLSLGARHRGYNIGQMANHETFNKTLSTPVDLHCTMCTSACLICGGKTLPLAHHCVHLCCGCFTRSNPIQSKSDSKQAVVVELHECDPPHPMQTPFKHRPLKMYAQIARTASCTTLSQVSYQDWLSLRSALTRLRASWVHGCQMAIARFLDCMCLALRA